MDDNAKTEMTVPADRQGKKRLLPVFGVLMLVGAYLMPVASMSYCLYSDGYFSLRRMIGSAGMVLVFYGVYGVFLYLRCRGVTSTFRRMLFLSLILGVFGAVIPFAVRVNACLTPVLIAVLLLALMIDRGASVFAVLPLAAVSWASVSRISGPSAGGAALMLSLIAVSLTAVFALKLRRTRTTVLLSSFIAGAVGAVVYTLTVMAGGIPLGFLPKNLLWLVGSCLLSGVLTVGSMPVLESIFDIASEERLNELLNNDNPLLKRLINEAPGTYHHSLLVASLAESAAEKVSADPLLVRVAAYYHDVGKLRSPLCFKENQKTGYNMHDDLDPYESAKRIIAHQQDGVTLLEKHKFPREIISIVGEHHGDSVMVYFYDKARKLAPEGTQPDESLFRYPSHKPSTKESALLMLADCCEAAVRSMVSPTMDDNREKVREVITHKWDKRDSMLWASPLTFAEIKLIEESFIDTFTALYHERVEYPDLEEIDVR